jgi:hypothetical protein
MEAVSLWKYVIAHCWAAVSEPLNNPGSYHVTCVYVLSAPRNSKTVFSTLSGPRLYNAIPFTADMSFS